MMAYVCRLFATFVLILFVAAVDLKSESVKNQRFKYPSIRRDESVVDDYYGIKVSLYNSTFSQNFCSQSIE